MKIAPSILSADFARLGSDVAKVLQAGAELVHIDVMDGVFVPNISVGLPVIESLRRSTDGFFDVHLMIVDPLKYIGAFAAAGSDLISFHVEAAGERTGETIAKIRECGKKVGIVLSPDSPVDLIRNYLEHVDLVLVMTVHPGFGGQKFMPEMRPKLEELKKLRQECGYTYEIEVDGGINEKTAADAAAWGADILVAGSYVFGADDPAKAIAKLKGTDV